ncbi:hypothetical protein [Flavobacterium aestivum]|uniref:hypothetical protein n=1 Tax=Flavobacterium aestivum TaxID=3003257 RepID=UPI002286C5ED|nr:hypothetical protein [Flavobacterium aestivum]
MSLRNVIITVGIVGAFSYFLLGDKIKKIVEQLQNVKVLPVAFKNLNAKWNDGMPYVTFKLDLKVINPTPVNFNANIVAVTLKRILFYDKKNVLFGSSELNINAITIPANSSITLKDIPIALDLKTAINTALSIIQNDGLKVDDVRIVAVISVLGIDYKLT